jgi:hypothetical protein
MRKQGFFLLISVTLLLVACQKDELTLPTSVDVQFNLNPYQETDIEVPSGQALLKISSKNDDDDDDDNNGDGPGLIKKMELSEATFFISDIQIEGIRKQGEDVYLNIQYDTPLQIELGENSNSTQELSFDLPQGVYQKLEVRLFLGNEEIPAVRFSGDITPGNSKTVRFSFHYESEEQITIQAIRKNGRPTDNIVLNKDQTEKVSLTLDAGYLFEYFPIPLLATTKQNDITAQIEVNITNKNKNDKPFFSLMQGRLEKSFSFVFQ